MGEGGAGGCGGGSVEDVVRVSGVLGEEQIGEIGLRLSILP